VAVSVSFLFAVSSILMCAGSYVVVSISDSVNNVSSVSNNENITTRYSPESRDLNEV
jgi:peptidoglycan biosynthesis protein MviN/MurJ (putative lipid II flippase)